MKAVDTMLYKSYVNIDYDKEIGRVDKAIVALSNELEDLVYKRYELIARKHDLDAQELMACIVENDMMPKEVVEVLVSALGKNAQKQ